MVRARASADTRWGLLRKPVRLIVTFLEPPLHKTTFYFPHRSQGHHRLGLMLLLLLLWETQLSVR